jgi:hypothetical protein
MPLYVFPLFPNQNTCISYMKGQPCPSNLFGMDDGPGVHSQTVRILSFDAIEPYPYAMMDDGALLGASPLVLGATPLVAAQAPQLVPGASPLLAA